MSLGPHQVDFHRGNVQRLGLAHALLWRSLSTLDASQHADVYTSTYNGMLLAADNEMAMKDVSLSATMCDLFARDYYRRHPPPSAPSAQSTLASSSFCAQEIVPMRSFNNSSFNNSSLTTLNPASSELSLNPALASTSPFLTLRRDAPPKESKPAYDPLSAFPCVSLAPSNKMAGHILLNSIPNSGQTFQGFAPQHQPMQQQQTQQTQQTKVGQVATDHYSNNSNMVNNEYVSPKQQNVSSRSPSFSKQELLSKYRQGDSSMRRVYSPVRQKLSSPVPFEYDHPDQDQRDDLRDRDGSFSFRGQQDRSNSFRRQESRSRSPNHRVQNHHKYHHCQLSDMRDTMSSSNRGRSRSRSRERDRYRDKKQDRAYDDYKTSPSWKNGNHYDQRSSDMTYSAQSRSSVQASSSHRTKNSFNHQDSPAKSKQQQQQQADNVSDKAVKAAYRPDPDIEAQTNPDEVPDIFDVKLTSKAILFTRPSDIDSISGSSDCDNVVAQHFVQVKSEDLPKLRTKCTATLQNRFVVDCCPSAAATRQMEGDVSFLLKVCADVKRLMRSNESEIEWAAIAEDITGKSLKCILQTKPGSVVMYHVLQQLQRDPLLYKTVQSVSSWLRTYIAQVTNQSRRLEPRLCRLFFSWKWDAGSGCWSRPYPNHAATSHDFARFLILSQRRQSEIALHQSRYVRHMDNTLSITVNSSTIACDQTAIQTGVQTGDQTSASPKQSTSETMSASASATTTSQTTADFEDGEIVDAMCTTIPSATIMQSKSLIAKSDETITSTSIPMLMPMSTQTPSTPTLSTPTLSTPTLSTSTQAQEKHDNNAHQFFIPVSAVPESLHVLVIPGALDSQSQHDPESLACHDECIDDLSGQDNKNDSAS